MTLTARPSQIHDSRQEPGLPIPCQVRRPVPCRPVLDFHRFSGPIHAGGPPIRISRPPAIHKKPQSPQSHISQAVHCSPCLTDPHAPRIPIRVMFQYVSVDPPYRPQAPKNPTPNSARPAAGSRGSTHPTGLLKFHGPTTGGLASATTGRRAARRLRVGLKADPGAAARLEAGN